MALPPPGEGSTALITGASSGIGAAIARELAGRGHGVTLVARREERLRELAAELTERHGVRAEALAADLEGAAERERLVARVDELSLDVEVLVNNAGFGGSGSVADSEPERLTRMVRLNCEALVDLQARYTARMARRGRGAVINIASTSSFQPIPGTATYAATKAFVLSLSEATHSENGGRGVTVTAVCPGPVRTEFTEAAGIAHAEETTPDFVWSTAEDVAREAVDAAAKGRRVVVPGKLNHAGTILGQHSPRALALPVAKRVWKRAM